MQFVGNDSVTYTAKTTFSINRNGNLNNIEWSLTSENGQWVKVKEVEQQVITVTGLTYEQFCRTTMLAQGEFTKFMKSDQNAKAEILEKLTDTSVFSEIGRRIYEKYNAQKKAYEQLDSENENIVRLNDEQIAEYQAQINTIQSENKQLDEELNSLTQKATWIKQLAALQEDVIRSEKQWQAANTTLNSEENQQRRQRIAQWEQTENERNTLLELRKLHQNALEIAQSEKEFQLQYQQLTAGFLFLKEAIAQTGTSKKQLQESLDAQAYKSETFANAQSLSEKLKQYAQFGQNIAINKEKHRQNLLTLTASELTLAQKQTEINQKQAEIDKVGTALSELKEKVKAFDLTQLTSSQAQQKDRLRDLDEVNKSVQTLKNQQNEIKELKKTLAEKQQLVETLTAKRQQEQENYDKALAAQETAQNVYDSAAKSVNDFAKQVRATLQLGDICPVCGQKVVQLLTNEAAEESVVKLKNALEEAKRTTVLTRKQLDVTITSLKTEEGNLNSLKGDVQHKSLKQKNDLVALEEVCKRLQIIVNDTIQDQINQQLADTEKVLREIEEKIAVSSILNQDIEKANDSLDNLKKQLEGLRKSYHEIQTETSCNKKMRAHR